MKKRSISIWPVFTACFLFLCIPAYGDQAGEFTRVQGRVDITSPGEPARAANVGDAVFESDIIRTKSGGHAEIRLSDDSLIRIASGARIKISSHMVRENESKSVLSLFRGKIRSIVSKISGGEKQFEIRTKTAVVGVRGTDFFVYYQQGASGAIFREGEGYAYNINQPGDVRIIKAGQAALVRTFDTPPIIRPVTALEMDRHSRDTSSAKPKGGETEVPESGNVTEDSGAEGSLEAETKTKRSATRQDSASAFTDFGGDVYVDERELFTEFAYTIDIASFDGEDFFYSLDIEAEDGAGIRDPETGTYIAMPVDIDIGALDPDEYMENAWDLFVGNTPGRFSDGASFGGSIFAGPIAREDASITDQGWGVSNLYLTGTYSEFNGQTSDQWVLDLDYRETGARRYYRFEGNKWSDGTVEAKTASAWVNWQECLTGIAGGNLSGSYAPDDGTWQATARFVAMETDRFLDMAENRKNDLELLDIPCVEIGRADLGGAGNNLSITMNDVIFFSYAAGGDPAIWATNSVSGSFTAAPQTGIPVQLSGSGLSADFTVRAWENGQWAATVENGNGVLTRSDSGPGNIGFQGGAAGTFDSTAGSFSGAGAGTADNQ